MEKPVIMVNVRGKDCRMIMHISEIVDYIKFIKFYYGDEPYEESPVYLCSFVVGTNYLYNRRNAPIYSIIVEKGEIMLYINWVGMDKNGVGIHYMQTLKIEDKK